MTTSESATAESRLDGPVRYTLAVVVSLTDEVVSMTIHGLALPRVGERLNFEVSGQPLSVKVVDIAHWFFVPEEDPRHREIIVTAMPLEVDMPVARQLLDHDVLARWCTRLAAVGPTRQ